MIQDLLPGARTRFPHLGTLCLLVELGGVCGLLLAAINAPAGVAGAMAVFVALVSVHMGLALPERGWRAMFLFILSSLTVFALVRSIVHAGS